MLVVLFKGREDGGARGFAVLAAHGPVEDAAVGGHGGQKALGVLDFDVAPDGGGSVDLVVGEQPVLGDFEVEQAHAGEDELVGLFVFGPPDGRILARELAEGFFDLFRGCLGVGLDGDEGYCGRRVEGLDVHGAELLGGLGVVAAGEGEDGVTGASLFQAGESADLAGAEVLDVLVVLCRDVEERLGFLERVHVAVVQVVAAVESAVVDADETHHAAAGVVDDLEDVADGCDG